MIKETVEFLLDAVVLLSDIIDAWNGQKPYRRTDRRGVT